MRAAAGVVLGGLLATGCAAMTNSAPKPVRDLNLPPLIKDPAWIRGDCQSKLRSKGVLGLCAVVNLGKPGRPLTPGEVAEQAGQQGKSQLLDATRRVLERMVDNCAAQCATLPQGPPRLDLLARLTTAIVEQLGVSDTWLAGDGHLYALVAVNANTFVNVINHQQDLDEAARRELANRAHDALR